MKVICVLVCVLLVTASSLGFSQEKKPMKMADPGMKLKESIERGKALFDDASLGTNGMSCGACHMEGGTKPGKMGDMEIKPFTHVKMQYPKYFKMADRVMTLDQVINWCIVNPMKGPALAWDDQKLSDLAAYVSTVNAMKGEKAEGMEKMKKKE